MAARQYRTPADEATGLLLIGHGSRDPLGTAQFFQIAETLRHYVSSLNLAIPVEPALLEFQTPTIQQGWDRLVATGAKHIYVAPLLLFSAGHARQDIPDEIARCVQRTPAVRWSIGQPLSRHRAVIELLCQRVSQAWASASNASGEAKLAANHTQANQEYRVNQDGGANQEYRANQDGGANREGGGEPFDLLIVGRGSRDPCARSDMLVLSEIVRHRLQLQSVRTAFYAMAQPRLSDILESMAAEVTPRQIVVCPHLLFDGRLYQAITAQVDTVARQHPQHRFRVTGYLGPEPPIAQAIWERTVGAGDLAGSTRAGFQPNSPRSA